MHNKLKNLNAKELASLAENIRGFLIRSISDTGGHLASNLGVVELTLALHAVFSSPKDKFVWDVGHQSYVHKILTGRKNAFSTLRKMDGLSGFPKVRESEHDAFGTGHSSTAISAALGLAAARDALGKTGKVVAIVGDGSMTGGQSYEGLNNAGRANTDLLVVLNDNQMSIGKNVGAISRHLNDIRTTPAYLGAKRGAHNLLDNLPLVGAPLSKGLETAKDILKYMVIKGVLFEELGFRYFGPVDGHDIKSLVEVMRRIKDIKGPVLLHVLTQKGKGYAQAEDAPHAFHGVEAFEVKTGQPTNDTVKETYAKVFSEHLCKRAVQNSHIAAITAAMPDGTGLTRFATQFPNRFFDVGIAEAHAVTFAAGLAINGMRPVVAVYSSFLQRAYDQILHDVALQNLPVIFAIDRAGIVGEDGETHQGLYDLAFLSHIPNIVILAPANAGELRDMLDFALAHNGPVAIRYPRGEAAPQGGDATPPIIYGCAQTVRTGANIALVSVGTMLATALKVADNLQEAGFSPSVYNARFIKPIDETLLFRLKDYGYVFVLEDAAQWGGVGERLGVPQGHRFAFPDRFIESGTQEELFARYKLDAVGITNRIKEIIK
ncbi:MAG: 1-deoxy-D-xylulose-5-phosphate synthase [Defluviitaleaceae bacterium]|nr:1-deoxy-D-xylulose-5-phosphate synthase [Defluviitaleaceae bacterium]MCL2274327.1 1-deoxy-D-xylulose-5-phosphate synthase [Defluviitaleaceae bacterium]